MQRVSKAGKLDFGRFLFVITILFFILGFVNIGFGVVGFICMIMPFVLLLIFKRKVWCQKICPRVRFFETFFGNFSIFGNFGPKWLTRGKMKWIILGYFVFNLFVLTMSTIMVAKGRVSAVENVRFLIAFQIPAQMPQILANPGFSEWFVHLAYRMYSMMMSTTILGLVLAALYKPRTWCTVCPVNTLSDIISNKSKVK